MMDVSLPASAYTRLADRFARIATIGEASAILGWDAAAMMPPGGGAARGDQLAVLAGLAHGILTAPPVADELAEAEADGDGSDPWQVANLRLMRHAHTRATAVPPELVEAQARANSACEKVWREARRTADFALVRDRLARGHRAGARTSAGARAGTRSQSIRRAAGRLSARHPRRRRRSRVPQLRDFPARGAASRRGNPGASPGTHPP